jgi:hypothetical protein
LNEEEVAFSMALVDASEVALRVVRSLGFSPSDSRTCFRKHRFARGVIATSDVATSGPGSSPSPTAKPDDRGGGG